MIRENMVCSLQINILSSVTFLPKPAQCSQALSSHQISLACAKSQHRTQHGYRAKKIPNSPIEGDAMYVCC